MEIPIEDYFSWLYTFQVELHGGRASGTEFATACFGGFHRAARLETADGPRLLRQRLSCPQFKVVIGDTRIPAPTKIAAGKVMPQMMKQDQAKIEKAFKAIAELVPSAEAALLSGNMKALGNVMTENQKILRDDLRVSHPKLDSLVEAALRAGAYGAKLSGGGMGGVMFAVADPTRMEAVASALKEAGARVFTTNLGGSGVACTRD
jgi:mevalonate kinase